VLPPAAEAPTSFDLTGQTGSLMYMAPEVYLQQPYNEKVGFWAGPAVAGVQNTVPLPGGSQARVECWLSARQVQCKHKQSCDCSACGAPPWDPW
jgi:serine/threonine protein kinase